VRQYISTWEDAAQYIAAGANAVEICTEVMLSGYKIIGPLRKGLHDYLEAKGFTDIRAIQNKAAELLTAHEALQKTPLTYPQINHSTCGRCGKCVTICEESEHQALQLIDGYIQVNEERCVGCGLCRFACPTGAIGTK
jgi:dihydropyrimidine dehydrogenase (NAD+) subunit PreA